MTGDRGAPGGGDRRSLDVRMDKINFTLCTPDIAHEHCVQMGAKPYLALPHARHGLIGTRGNDRVVAAMVIDHLDLAPGPAFVVARMRVCPHLRLTHAHRTRVQMLAAVPRMLAAELGENVRVSMRVASDIYRNAPLEAGWRERPTCFTGYGNVAGGTASRVAAMWNEAV